MKVTSVPCLFPPSIWTRLPSRASITTAGAKTSPLPRLISSAPANPTDSTRAGWYNAITASAARRAASRPIPPQTTTISSRSKKTNLRPSYSRSTRLQPLVSPLTSRSSAATIAILGIPVGPEPLYRPTQCPIRGHRLPAQFSLCLARTGPHLFLSHTHRLDGCARLAPQQSARHRLIHSAGGIGDKVRQLQCGRRQTCNRSQLVQNLLQRQVLAAQNVALAALAFFQRCHVSARAFPNIDQVQSRLHICGKLPLQKVHDDPS